MGRWGTFIESAPRGVHGVRVYQADDDLAAAVSAYFEAGFRAGSPAVAVVTADRRRSLTHTLQLGGWSVDDLERERLLVWADADDVLHRILDGPRPSAERFRDIAGGLLDEAAAGFAGRTVRAFGEMVDLLWQSGDRAAAIELEELWNELGKTRNFSLLCAYRLDVLDLDVEADALPEVLRVHTHAHTVSEPSKFSAAVDRALTELVGPTRTARIYLDVADRVPHDDVPRGQAVLIWLSRTERSLADQVLRRVRSHLGPDAVAAARTAV